MPDALIQNLLAHVDHSASNETHLRKERVRVAQRESRMLPASNTRPKERGLDDAEDGRRVMLKKYRSVAYDPRSGISTQGIRETALKGYTAVAKDISRALGYTIGLSTSILRKLLSGKGLGVREQMTIEFLRTHNLRELFEDPDNPSPVDALWANGLQPHLLDSLTSEDQDDVQEPDYRYEIAMGVFGLGTMFQTTFIGAAISNFFDAKVTTGMLSITIIFWFCVLFINLYFLKVGRIPSQYVSSYKRLLTEISVIEKQQSRVYLDLISNSYSLPGDLQNLIAEQAGLIGN